MRLLPYESFTIQSQEPLSNIIEKLNAQIEDSKVILRPFSSHHALYKGTISSSGFEIRRIIHYRNSFLPNIRGRFDSSSDGTFIRITMRLHPFVTVFLLFWCSVWYSISIPMFLAVALSGDAPLEGWLFLGMPIAMLFVFWCAFWSEANRSRRELTQIILGEPHSIEPPISGNLHPKMILISIEILLFLIIFIIIIQPRGINNSLPLISNESQPLSATHCSQDTTQSPYCNFLVIHTIERHPNASTIAISADSKTLISGGQDKAIKVWDLETGELKKTLQSDSGVINTLAIAPDGKTIVSGSGDRMVRIWDITSNQRPQVLKGHSSDIRQIEISSDGKIIISRSFDEIKLWNLATGKLKATLPNFSPTKIEIGPIVIEDNSPYFHTLTISPDGETALVNVGSKFVAWDLATNQQKVLQTSWLNYVYSPRISLDGQTAVTTSYRQPVSDLKIWDLKTARLKAQSRVSSSPNQRGLSDIALSRDRIIGSTHEGLKVWNLETAELEATLDKEPMSNLVISSDGKLLAGITGNSEHQNRKIQVLQRP